jgi:hypothetical protein
MPDNRQTLLNEAVEKLRDAGCSFVSIMAQWPDKTHKSSVLVMDSTGDPWAKQRQDGKKRK